MDKFSRKARSALMSKIRTSGTDIEIELLKCVRPFWRFERYRRNIKRLPGKPDIVFSKSKLAIFADGDFWHGLGFNKWKTTVSLFWKKKIGSNIKRDKKNNKLLKKMGYAVLRFWGSKIKKQPKVVQVKIKLALTKRNPNELG